MVPVIIGVTLQFVRLKQAVYNLTI